MGQSSNCSWWMIPILFLMYGNQCDAGGRRGERERDRVSHKEVEVKPTGENGFPHALSGDISLLLFPFSGKRSLKHKSAQVVGSLKQGRSLVQCLSREVRLHVCDLDVGVV